MTVVLEEVAQRKHPKQQARKKKVRRPIGIGHNLGPPLSDDQVLTFRQPPLSDDQVLTFFEWIKLNSISPRNGRRILQSGDGPRVVRLSARRIGITIRANREWQQSRERA